MNLCDKDFARDVAALTCGVRTEEVSWSASFSGFDAGDLIAARPVTNDFCFQIRQTRALQRNAPVRTESANPPAATVNPVGALHAGKERRCSGGQKDLRRGD